MFGLGREGFDLKVSIITVYFLFKVKDDAVIVTSLDIVQVCELLAVSDGLIVLVENDKHTLSGLNLDVNRLSLFDTEGLKDVLWHRRQLQRLLILQEDILEYTLGLQHKDSADGIVEGESQGAELLPKVLNVTRVGCVYRSTHRVTANVS